MYVLYILRYYRSFKLMIRVHGEILAVSYIHMKYLKVKRPLKFSLTSWELVRGEAAFGDHLAVTAKGFFSEDPCWKKAREFV